MNTDNQHEASFQLSPGQLLSAAREQRGLSQDAVAQQLRLSIETIQEIEQDNYANIGVKTFVRGYLCGYARLVRFSEAQVLEAFVALGSVFPEDIVKSPQPVSSQETTAPAVLNMLNEIKEKVRNVQVQWAYVLGGSFFFLFLIVASFFLFHSQKPHVIAQQADVASVKKIKPVAPIAVVKPLASTNTPVTTTVKKPAQIFQLVNPNPNLKTTVKG